MTLVIDLFDPEQGDYAYLNAVVNDAAGFESYRVLVWGSAVFVEQGYTFFPQLREHDLFVYRNQLDAFAAECHHIKENAPALALALWGDEAGAQTIVRYMDRFLPVIALAKERNLGVCIS